MTEKMSFEVLLDRWEKFPDIYSHDFKELIENTLDKASLLTTLSRAKIISLALKNAADLAYYSRRWRKERSEEARKILFDTVNTLLETGFKNEEIKFDLLSKAPNVEIFENMLKAGINPKSAFQSNAIVKFASEPDDFPMFLRLLEEGVKPELLKDGKIQEPLLNFRCLSLLYEKGVELNVIDQNGCNPFFELDYKDNVDDSIKLLQKSGCDINHINNAANNALWECRTIEVFKALIKSGIEFQEGTNSNKSIIEKITEDEYGCKDKLKFLIESGLDVNKINNGNPNIFALFLKKDNAYLEESIQLLFSGGFDVNLTDNSGDTAIKNNFRTHRSDGLFATTDKVKYYNSLEFILNHENTMIDIQNHSGETPLMFWAGQVDDKYSRKIFQTLIKNGADIHRTDNMGLDALMYAAKSHCEQSIKILLKKKANAQKRSLNGWSCLEWCLSNEVFPSNSLILMLLDGGAEINGNEVSRQNMNLLGKIIGNNDLLFGTELLKRGAKINRSVLSSLGLDIESLSEREVPPAESEAYKLLNLSLKNPDLFFSSIEQNDEELLSALKKATKRFQSKIASDPFQEFEEFHHPPACLDRERIIVSDIEFMSDESNPIFKRFWREKTISAPVRSFFLKEPQKSIKELIPVAVGKLNKKREKSEKALRYIAGKGFEKLIKDIAKDHGPDVLKSIDEILLVDRCTDFEINEGFDELNILELPNIIIKETGKPLDNRYLTGLLRMMSISEYDNVYPVLEKLLPMLELDSLAEFSWSLFQIYPGESLDVRGFVNWKHWIYESFAYMGNEQTVQKLVRLINSLPKTNKITAAETGLDILMHMDNDTAIRAINTIRMKTRYGLLKDKASENLERIANIRGLSADDLDDRVMPTFGLDRDNALILDYGFRSFEIDINEKLVPTVIDGNGKCLKALPKPNKSDDQTKAKEAQEFWKTLKTGLKKEGPSLLLRFEQAMINGRQWKPEDFKKFIIAHPLLSYIVKHIVWAEISGGKIIKLFRVNSENNVVDANDKVVEIDKTSMVIVPHPLHIQSSLEEWKSVLIQHKLKQPFPQIARGIYARNEDKKKDLFGLQGAIVSAQALRALRGMGWSAEIGSAGCLWSYQKGDASIDFNGAVTMTDIGMDEDLNITVSISNTASDIDFSETIREIKTLLY